MNARNSFFSGHQQKITERLDVLRFCSKGDHKPNEQGYFCLRCTEPLKRMPEWEVHLICFKGELVTSTVSAEDEETALVAVLSNNIEYLLKGQAYKVLNKDTGCVTAVEVDDLLFNEIFDEYEYMNNCLHISVTDEMIPHVIKNFIILAFVMLLIHWVVSDNFPVFKGLMSILSVSGFLTSLLHKGYVISERHKEKDQAQEKGDTQD